MVDFSYFELMEFLKDDIPYLDLTTSLQNIDDKKVRFEIFTRDDIIVSCVSLAKRLILLNDCEVVFCAKDKEKLKKDDILISFSGDYNKVHKIYRTIMLLLEYASKIATYSNQMVELAQKINPNCQVLTTRKTYPFAKKFCIKAILDGGAKVHRLNLSETILFFPHHRIVYKDDFEFYSKIDEFKNMMPEKKIIVESNNYEDSVNLLKSNADVLQLDKVPFDEIKKIIDYRDKYFKDRKIIASGGINLSNIEEYAKTGIDSVVTSSIYLQGMADLGSRLEVL